MHLANKTHPKDIEITLQESLAAYLNGQITANHLSRIIKKQLLGKRSKLSSRLVKLFPKFNQLTKLLQKSTYQSLNKNDMNKSLKNLTGQIFAQLR